MDIKKNCLNILSKANCLVGQHVAWKDNKKFFAVFNSDEILIKLIKNILYKRSLLLNVSQHVAQKEKLRTC